MKVDCTQSLSFLLVIERLERARCLISVDENRGGLRAVSSEREERVTVWIFFPVFPTTALCFLLKEHQSVVDSCREQIAELTSEKNKLAESLQEASMVSGRTPTRKENARRI